MKKVRSHKENLGGDTSGEQFQDNAGKTTESGRKELTSLGCGITTFGVWILNGWNHQNTPVLPHSRRLSALTFCRCSAQWNLTGETLPPPRCLGILVQFTMVMKVSAGWKQLSELWHQSALPSPSQSRTMVPRPENGRFFGQTEQAPGKNSSYVGVSMKRADHSLIFL